MKRENTSSEHEEMKLKDKKKGDKRLRKERSLFLERKQKSTLLYEKIEEFFVKNIMFFNFFFFFGARAMRSTASVISSTSGAAMMGGGESYSTKALALHSAGASDVSRASAKEQLACVCNKASPNVTPSRPKM